MPDGVGERFNPCGPGRKCRRLRLPDIVSISTFIVATLALYVLRRLGFSGCPVRLESDSFSALGWAEKRDSQERQESKQCLEGILSGLGQLGTQSPFESFGFVMGKDNFMCDSLSRDTVVADLGIVGLINFGPYCSSTLLRTLEFATLLGYNLRRGLLRVRGALRSFLNSIEVSSQDDGTTILRVSQLPLRTPTPSE